MTPELKQSIKLVQRKRLKRVIREHIDAYGLIYAAAALALATVKLSFVILEKVAV